MSGVNGKVAIITGASSGMGKAMAELFAKKGAKVVACDINYEALESVVSAIRETGAEIIGVKTNVASEEDISVLVDTAVETFGTVDILVNNAGIMDGVEPVGEIETERYRRVMAVNTDSVIFASRKVMPIFLEKGAGVIVNNVSAAGVAGCRGGAAYTASKHAVIGITKNTAFMYAPNGIRCNAIATGAVKTGIAATMTNVSKFGGARQYAGLPLNPRIADAIEVAEVALFLASDEASFVNGAVVSADGGWTAY